MYEVGSVLYGYFYLNENLSKNKYVIVFDLSDDTCLLTTFTTSQPRSGSLDITHGRNPVSGIPMSYVFLKDVEIGIDPNTNLPFCFPQNTTIVPDYGFSFKLLSEFQATSKNLKKVCQLYNHEINNLIYTLYHCTKTPKNVKKIFEKKLEEMNKVS